MKLASFIDLLAVAGACLIARGLFVLQPALFVMFCGGALLGLARHLAQREAKPQKEQKSEQ